MINPVHQRDDCYNHGAIAWNCLWHCDKPVGFDSYPEDIDGCTEFRIRSDLCLHSSDGSFKTEPPGMVCERFWAQQ
jgi:hypothetical protein